MDAPSYTMRKNRDQLIADIGSGGLSEPQRAAARAQLDSDLASDFAALVGKIRENIYEALAELASQVAKARVSSDTTARSIIRSTKVLAAATVVLALATIALVWATLRLSSVPK